MPDLKALDALTAYNQALKRQQGLGDGSPLLDDGAKATAGQDFASFLENAVHDTVSNVNKAEQVGVQAASGKGDIVDMVTAINNAELTLETVVTIRDKVIAAYQDIIKMPI